MRKGNINFGNYDYFLESADQIIEGSTPVEPTAGGDDQHVFINDPVGFV